MTATTSSRTDIGVLADLVEIDQVEKRAAVHKLQLVLTWARAHRGVEGECASWDPQLAGICVDQDGLDHLGGPGTPAVAEFALEQLATRLGVGRRADSPERSADHPISPATRARWSEPATS